MNNQSYHQHLLAQCRAEIRTCTIHALRRYLIDLPLERYGLDKSSDKYLLLTEQIEIARNELEIRTIHKYSSGKDRS